jgi:hypothetical protein
MLFFTSGRSVNLSVEVGFCRALNKNGGLSEEDRGPGQPLIGSESDFLMTVLDDAAQLDGFVIVGFR